MSVTESFPSPAAQRKAETEVAVVTVQVVRAFSGAKKAQQPDGGGSVLPAAGMVRQVNHPPVAAKNAAEDRAQ